MTNSMSTSNKPAFPSDQAAILQDLARDGAADEASMCSYADMGSNIQSNGAGPSQEYSFSDAYPTAGLSNSYQEMEDHSALLGNLVAFEHPPANDSRSSVSNDHFASLLQAAGVTGGGGEMAQTESGQEHGTAAQSGDSSTYGFFNRTFDRQPTPKRKRTARGLGSGDIGAEEEEEPGYGLISNKRRKRTPSPEDPEQLAREREIWGPESTEADDDEEDSDVPDDSFQQSPVTTAKARALGVHSAAALFRRPSKASKKYTRPPMSRLFTTLAISPDLFIELQNAAKLYMLDDDFPERRDCVGSKGNAESDLVRLKLFAEVESFLMDGGWGERCFGMNSEGYAARKYKWPQDRSKLVTAVTPLLRRMVTNERQRIYALETRQEKRKAGAKTNSKRKRGQTSATPSEGTSQRKRGQRGTSPSSAVIDPKLDEYHYHVEEPYPIEGQGQISMSQVEHAVASQFSLGQPDGTGLRYHLNILQDGKRVKSPLMLTPSSCPGFASLVQYIHTFLDDSGRKPNRIKILCPNGLVEVNSEEGWDEAVAMIKENDWMDGDVRCVVDLMGEL